MSAGEAYEMCLNIDTLNQMLDSLSSDVNFETGYKYWTSTQKAGSVIWIVDEYGSLSNNMADYTGPFTVPIYSLYD